ncbi:NAD(P)H-dependent oxidoreductase [Rhodocaloribacter litoris]|uniref:NADPH-dependent FMN reductase n=1 Tax=Rhodocaloribacter litoris TaxID=2558931 RepID=UPI00141D9A43|nr:NAD(P)H-dependent oxidoreductase [Rhodocaloribacter litoris]QXD16424.1 NAD(P)H-dependent oxidoreductase [Rhodocaloribacter litoris]
MAASSLHILGLAGSLRARSYNRALLRAARELAPDGVEIETFDLAPIPLYNADLDTDERRPEAVTRLKEAITAADAVLLVSPEYNYGVPGVMKNALDWASRPGFRSPMAYKPTGIMGASAGASGTMRGQEQLKLNLLGMIAHVFPHPGVAVTRAADKFDDELNLVDEATRKFVRQYLEAFAGWVRRVQRPAEAMARG